MEEFLGPDETVVLQTRQHIFQIAADFLQVASIIVVAACAFWAINRPDFLNNQFGEILGYVVAVVAALMILRNFWHMICWQRARMFVTSEKVIFVHGVFNRHIDSTPLVKIDDMTVSQPFFGRIFGYGQLLVDDHQGNRQLLHGLRYIPKPAAVYRLVTESARRERAFEGGADMATFDDTPEQP